MPLGESKDGRGGHGPVPTIPSGKKVRRNIGYTSIANHEQVCAGSRPVGTKDRGPAADQDGDRTTRRQTGNCNPIPAPEPASSIQVGGELSGGDKRGVVHGACRGNEKFKSQRSRWSHLRGNVSGMSLNSVVGEFMKLSVP